MVLLALGSETTQAQTSVSSAVHAAVLFDLTLVVLAQNKNNSNNDNNNNNTLLHLCDLDNDGVVLRTVDNLLICNMSGVLGFQDVLVLHNRDTAAAMQFTEGQHFLDTVLRNERTDVGRAFATATCLCSNTQPGSQYVAMVNLFQN